MLAWLESRVHAWGSLQQIWAAPANLSPSDFHKTIIWNRFLSARGWRWQRDYYMGVYSFPIMDTKLRGLEKYIFINLQSWSLELASLNQNWDGCRIVVLSEARGKNSFHCSLQLLVVTNGLWLIAPSFKLSYSHPGSPLLCSFPSPFSTLKEPGDYNTLLQPSRMTSPLQCQ